MKPGNDTNEIILNTEGIGVTYQESIVAIFHYFFPKYIQLFFSDGKSQSSNKRIRLKVKPVIASIETIVANILS